MFGDAEAYERFMGRWSRLLGPRLVKFAGVRDTGRVLETGSGKNRCQVLGIDPSSEYVEFAKSRNPVPDRVIFEAGDARQLRFPDGDFRMPSFASRFQFHSRFLESPG
ncbi:MAG: class I SAM-dependent methyltransferase [Bryobacterales bacterium]|nr:class I SAM-dependent methyltransferase [Bryobacterales bacterium]